MPEPAATLIERKLAWRIARLERIILILASVSTTGGMTTEELQTLREACQAIRDGLQPR